MSKAFSQIGSDTPMYSKEDVDRITKYPGEPLFSFSAISDIHLRVEGSTNDDAGHDDLRNLFRVLKNRQDDMGLNLKYIFCTGDIGYDSKIGEIRAFNDIVTKHCPISFDSVFACNGNHDKAHSIGDWRAYMFSEANQNKVSADKNFMHRDDNFVFAFMSLLPDATVNGDANICYFKEGSGTEQWLRNVVAASANKTLILFMHYPFVNRRCFDTRSIPVELYDFENMEWRTKNIETAELNMPYAGLIDCGGNGETNVKSMLNYHGWKVTSSSSFDYDQKTEWENIIDILKQHQGGKTVVFSGHTHFVFDCEEYNASYRKGYPNINVSNITTFNTETRTLDDSKITTVHIPSLNYPRHFVIDYEQHLVNGQATISGSNPYRQPCQSWLVDVYNDKLILRGFETQVCHDKKYGDVLDKYTYTIDLTDFGVEDEVVEEEQEENNG